MNLDALLDSNLAPKGSKKCLLGRTLDELEEPYRSALRNLLEGDTASEVVAFRIREAGLKGSARLVLLHRRAICGCPPVEAPSE